MSEIDLLIQELRDTIDNQRETIEQLENIRKEAIEYMKTLSDEYAANDYDIKCEIFKKLFYDILNKGSDK